MMKTAIPHHRSVLAVFILTASFVFCDNALADKIYWTDFTDKAIRRVDLSLFDGVTPIDGTDLSKVDNLVTTGIAPRYIALDTRPVSEGGGKMYWANLFASPSDKVQRATLDGTVIDPTIVAAPSRGPYDIALDLRPGVASDERLYWSEYITDPGTIKRCSLSCEAEGGTPDTFIDNLDQPFGIALDLISTEKRIYWIDVSTVGSTGTILSAPLDNPSSVTTVASGLGNIRGIALDTDGGKVYWADFPNGLIQRQNMDGSESVETVVTNATVPFGLALDLNSTEKKLYWTENTHGFIRRTDLSNFTGPALDAQSSPLVQDVVTGLTAPFAIALQFEAQTAIPELPAGAFPAFGFMMSGLLLWMRRRFSG